MKLFPSVPIVENGLATTMFRRQWANAPPSPGKVLSQLVPNLPIVDPDGRPSRNFLLVWESSRDQRIDQRVPMVNPNGTPTKEFLRLWETI